MNIRRVSLAVCILLLVTGSVRADLHSESVLVRQAALSNPVFGGSPGAAERVRAECASDLGCDVGLLAYGGDDPFGRDLRLGVGLDASAQPAERVIRELPPLPGSATLFLWAALSVGGWHLVRSARDLHWGALPEWYHTGGPLQIGHSVPIDLNFSAAPPSCFEEPTGERPYLYRVRRELRPPCDAQSFLIIAAPRGPPSCSRL